ncbi:MAG: Tad domain-containing protein [Planctomycetes bacterium]|nr:Tad domain-containing protein [Planctomycetota bacterium]
MEAKLTGAWRLARDTRGAAAAFSSLSLLAVVLCVGYCINLADATHAKMRTQDAADAAAYSGGRVRGNLYSMMGFLNMGKAALYRRSVGYHLTDGQARLLGELYRVTGVAVDPNVYDPSSPALTPDASRSAYMYAKLADDMQFYIADRFTDLIGSETKWIATANNCELVESATGRSPQFIREWNSFRFWGHLIDMDLWEKPPGVEGWGFWDCNITQPIRYVDGYVEGNIASSPQLDLDPDNPWFPLLRPPEVFVPQVIGHAFQFEQNSIKAVVRAPAPEPLVLPGVLVNLNPNITCTAAAGCFSPTMKDIDAGPNLYTTDFRGQLLSLELTGFRDWLKTEDPQLEASTPWAAVEH